MIFHNTIQLQGNELKEAVRAAKGQEQAIFLIYLNTRKSFSPSDILGMLQRAGHNILLTSVRRSITNLTNKGELVMCGVTKHGLYGKPENLWLINKQRYPLITSEQQTLFA